MVEIEWATRDDAGDGEWFAGFCEEASLACGVKLNETISVLMTDDATIQLLNRERRGKDEATDVLSFAFRDFKGEWPETPNMNEEIGEIVISLETLAENAAYFKVDRAVELKRLFIHGALHILGKNHETNDENEPMLREQEEILARFVRVETS